VIFTPHSWSWNVGGRLAALYRLLERRLAKATDVIVAVSGQEAEEGRAVIGDLDSKVVVIPNGVDLGRFSTQGEEAERRADPLIVCVGRLSIQKGQDVAIRALARLKDESARLRLVGEESQLGEKTRLKELAESLGVGERMEWEGRVDDPAPHFRAADVVVAPSRWEGMSLVFLEAMACGAPLVISDVSGSEMVGQAGVIVPREDVNSLTDALDDLLANEPMRQRLSKGALAARSSIDLSLTLARNLELWHQHADASNRDSIGRHPQR
jgi:glycosyltransferase involved in cell wall biosynthesis